MSVIRDLTGAFKASLQRRSVENKLISKLTNKIDSGTLVGEKNYNTHYKHIKSMIRAGDHQGAFDYVKEKSIKLDRQTRKKYMSSGGYMMN